MRILSIATAFALLFVFSAFQTMSQSMMIDDFQSGADQRWRFFADTVMGGVSSGAVSFPSEGGKTHARLSGAVSTANNGGFIQIRRALETSPPSGTTGIRLIVRGNGERYFIHLRTSGTLLPWQYYQGGFDTGADWREIRIPLSAFKASGSMLRATPKPGSLRSVAIVAFGKDYQAEVEVREIGFY